MRVKSEVFLYHGHIKMQHYKNIASTVEITRFCLMLGTSPEVCSLLWDCFDHLNTMPDRVQDVHLLWGLMVSMHYVSESENCTLAGGVD